jgi:hypothetical protein
MSDTDRELLELAAKAAAIAGEYVSDYGSGDYGYAGNTEGILHEHPHGGWAVWNPLTDDGDALRLAVDLELEVYTATKDDQRACAVDSERRDCWAWEDVNGDKYEAMRRAIVRAAAEIGRNTP